MEKPSQVKTIQSVNRALDIMDALQGADGPLTLTELAELLKLNKTTVFHLIKTLELRNYVAMDQKTSRYSLGLKVFRLGQAVEKKTAILTLALPLMRKIRDKYNETLHLGLFQESGDTIHATYVEKVETTNPIRLESRIGHPVPLHCTALGKLFLSFLSPERLSKVMGEEPFTRYTATTPTTYDVLVKELETSRSRGWFFDNQEFQDNVYCIAVPVLDGMGAIVAGISISMPARRLPKNMKSRIVDDMVAMSRELSMKMGG